jgi:hypothetical protein
MHKNILYFIALLSLIFIISCEENSTGPEENIEPGRRDYTWEVDTIKSFNTLFRIWGSSPNDVWAITNGMVNENIYHYDGESWSTGEYLILGTQSIYGFGPDNIYIGGERGKIYNFDGEEWENVATLSKDGHDDVVFANIWGKNEKNIYAHGAYHDINGYANGSVIAHYRNGNWEMLNTHNLVGLVVHLYQNSLDEKLYTQVIKIGSPNDADSTLIYEYSNGNFRCLYGNLWIKGLQADISLVNNIVYFVIGNKIQVRNNNRFETILEVKNPNFYQRIWGRSRKDLFLMMTDGLAHYNGEDVKYLFNYESKTQVYGAALFKNEVFFLVDEYPTGLTLIYHGKLEN